MPRTHARILTSIWRDENFTKLTSSAQRVYILLLSQPDVSHCGVLAFRPKRWSALAPDTPSLRDDLHELCDERMVLIDLATEELWIRSFVKYDGLLKQPNMVKAMWAAFDSVLSEPIREGFQEGFQELISTPLDNPSGKVQGKGVGVGEGFRPVAIVDELPELDKPVAVAELGKIRAALNSRSVG